MREEEKEDWGCIQSLQHLIRRKSRCFQLFAYNVGLHTFFFLQRTLDSFYCDQRVNGATFFFLTILFCFFFFFFSPLESNHVLPCRTSSRQYKGSNFYLLNGKKKNINCNSPHSMYMCMPKCRFVHIIIASGSLPTF